MASSRFLFFLFAVLLFSCASYARGPIVVDFNGFYYTDSVKRTDTESTTSLFWSLFFGFSVDGKGRFQAGWNYGSFSVDEDETAGATTYASTQMGPGFVYYIDKSRTWRLFFAYNLETSADYEAPSVSSETWGGTSMQADFGYHFQMNDVLALALRLNYVSSSYTESKVGSTTTDQSYSRTHMYPSLALAVEF